MQSLVNDIKGFLAYKKKVRIDNLFFTLHKVTAGILFFLSLLISTAFLVKDPIACINDKTIDRVVEAFCWIKGSYSVILRNSSYDFGRPSHPGHPGVETYDPLTDKIRVHKYYQWVCFVLFFQALCFYAPRSIWKMWEEGRIKALSHDLDDFIQDKDAREKRKIECQRYFYNVMGHNDGWSMKYALCEVLNFINVIVQIDLTDRFLGRALSTHGLSLIQFSRRDPMLPSELSLIFPTVTKCTFHAYGPTGNIVPYDAMCVLPLNMYNEKFYPILWLWFIILAVLSGLAIIYRFVTFLFPELRYKLLCKKFHIPNEELDHIWELNRKLDYGDWYYLYQIGKNMGPNSFLDFLTGISEITSMKKVFDDDDKLSNEKLALQKEKYL